MPTTGLYRLLTVIEAMLGFVFFSMVTTHFLSVYSSLIKRNAFAQGLYHGTQRTNDAAEFLARLADDPDLLDARQRLSAMAGFLRQIYQTHRSYPVLSYFHSREPYYALPRVLFTALDTVTLASTALNKERYSRLVDSPALDEVFEAALALIRELIADAPPRQPAEEDAALHVRADTAAGTKAYIALRTARDRSLHDLAVAMFYEWEASDISR